MAVILSINSQQVSAFSSKILKDTKVMASSRSTSSSIEPRYDSNTLSKYMSLPVEQYVLIPMPLNSKLSKVEEHDGDDGQVVGNESKFDAQFELIVPPISFRKLSLQPVVYATVKSEDNEVVVSSSNCTLRGSPFIDKVQMNERFDFRVETRLTWDDVHSCRATSDSDYCFIHADTTIEIDVDVPSPFSIIPNVILQKMGTAAVILSLKMIESSFVNSLASDYIKWSSDEEYRSYRAAFSNKEAGFVAKDLNPSELKIG